MSPGALSDRSSIIAEEEQEWGRRRRELDEAPSTEGHDDVSRSQSTADRREAQALDKAMEDRMIARKSSASSVSSAASSGIRMGAAWRTRYKGRKRTPSIASNRTSRSILSEDLVEEEEEQMLLGVGGGFEGESLRQKGSPTTEGEDSSMSSASMSADDGERNGAHLHSTVPFGTPRTVRPRPLSLVASRPPPSTPAYKTVFSLSTATSGTAFKLPRELPRPSSTTKSSSERTRRPSLKTTKHRPPPLDLLPPVPSSPRTPISLPAPSPAIPLRLRTESRTPAPPPPHLCSLSRLSGPHKSQAISQDARTPSQTLFVFPPSPTHANTSSCTPSAMTLTSNLNNSIPFPSISTPRVTTFRTHKRTRSYIGLGAPPTPTTAYSIVDAKGWISVEKERTN
jgi:tyrosine-protein phosphatase